MFFPCGIGIQLHLSPIKYWIDMCSKKPIHRLICASAFTLALSWRAFSANANGNMTCTQRMWSWQIKWNRVAWPGEYRKPINSSIRIFDLSLAFACQYKWFQIDFQPISNILIQFSQFPSVCIWARAFEFDDFEMVMANIGFWLGRGDTYPRKRVHLMHENTPGKWFIAVTNAELNINAYHTVRIQKWFGRLQKPTHARTLAPFRANVYLFKWIHVRFSIENISFGMFSLRVVFDVSFFSLPFAWNISLVEWISFVVWYIRVDRVLVIWHMVSIEWRAWERNKSCVVSEFGIARDRLIYDLITTRGLCSAFEFH